MAMRRLAVTLVALPLAAHAQPPGWAEAVAELRAERGRAVACAARARPLEGEKADRLRFQYDTAKAEVDAVIAGLSVTLAQRGTPADLHDLQARMLRGVQERVAFCELVLEHARPAPTEASALGELLGAFAEPLSRAVASLWAWWRSDDTLRRDIIRKELEATRWPEFSMIPRIPTGP